MVPIANGHGQDTDPRRRRRRRLRRQRSGDAILVRRGGGFAGSSHGVRHQPHAGLPHAQARPPARALGHHRPPRRPGPRRPRRRRRARAVGRERGGALLHVPRRREAEFAVRGIGVGVIVRHGGGWGRGDADVFRAWGRAQAEASSEAFDGRLELHRHGESVWDIGDGGRVAGRGEEGNVRRKARRTCAHRPQEGKKVILFVDFFCLFFIM